MNQNYSGLTEIERRNELRLSRICLRIRFDFRLFFIEIVITVNSQIFFCSADILQAAFANSAFREIYTTTSQYHDLQLVKRLQKS